MPSQTTQKTTNEPDMLNDESDMPTPSGKTLGFKAWAEGNSAIAITRFYPRDQCLAFLHPGVATAR
jgi:hypothetical protein